MPLWNPKVRKAVLIRANGRCELCDEPGFEMANGKVFLETHHVTSLAEGGLDTSGNVVPLCPNHHREAHYGASSREMRTQLFARLKTRVT